MEDSSTEEEGENPDPDPTQNQTTQDDALVGAGGNIFVKPFTINPHKVIP